MLKSGKIKKLFENWNKFWIQFFLKLSFLKIFEKMSKFQNCQYNDFVEKLAKSQFPLWVFSFTKDSDKVLFSQKIEDFDTFSHRFWLILDQNLTSKLKFCS